MAKHAAAASLRRWPWLAFVIAATDLLATSRLVLAANAGSAEAQADAPDPEEDEYDDLGLIEIPKGSDKEVEAFVAQHMEPRNAVAVVTAGKGTKRHLLLKEMAEDQDLIMLMAFGIRYEKSSSLTVHRLGAEDPIVKYTGKWTRGAIRKWLETVAYPLVRRLEHGFAPQKYLSHSPAGVVMVVKDNDVSSALIDLLEFYAERFEDKLKFTFFSKDAFGDSELVQSICDDLGIRTNDELLLVENPRVAVAGPSWHQNREPARKYRLAGVTASRVDQFFQDYTSGVLPRYFKSAKEQISRTSLGPPPRGVREITGSDFVEVVSDPFSSVMVAFMSQKCKPCMDFAPTLQEVAAVVQDSQRQGIAAFANLTIARIDQTANDHPELVLGSPWLRYWPRILPGRSVKKTIDVDIHQTKDGTKTIFNWLERQLTEELEILAEHEDAIAAQRHHKADL